MKSSRPRSKRNMEMLRPLRSRLTQAQMEKIMEKEEYGRFKKRVPQKSDDLSTYYAQRRLEIDGTIAVLMRWLKTAGIELYGILPHEPEKRKETRIKVTDAKIIPNVQINPEEIITKIKIAERKVRKLSKEISYTLRFMQEQELVCILPKDKVSWTANLKSAKTHPNTMPLTLREMKEKIFRLLQKKDYIKRGRLVRLWR